MQSSRLKGGQQRWQHACTNAGHMDACANGLHAQLQCSQWFMRSSEQSGPQGSHQPSVSGTGPWGRRWCRGQAGDAVPARVSVYQCVTKMFHGRATKLQLLCRCFFRDCTCANWSVPRVSGHGPRGRAPLGARAGHPLPSKGQECQRPLQQMCAGRCMRACRACGPLHHAARARARNQTLVQLRSQAQRKSCWNALATPRAALHGLQPGLQNADSWCSYPVCALLQGLTLTYCLHERCSAPRVALSWSNLNAQRPCVRICEFEHFTRV